MRKKGFWKQLLVGLIIGVLFLVANTPVYGKNKSSSKKDTYVAFDFRKVIFPHAKHQKIIKRLGADCQTCHHRQREGKKPRACEGCHARKQVSSKGKYARMGQKLNQKDVYHLLCWQCHKKMSQTGYKKPNGSSGKIPSKCQDCHLVKNDRQVSLMKF